MPPASTGSDEVGGTQLVKTKLPPAPKGLESGGRRLWRSVVADFELHQAELDVLERACRSCDYVRRLDRVVARDGLGDPSDPSHVHPALVESRLQSQVLARLIALLRLPDENDVRPQRRGGFRGPYRKARALSIAVQRARLQVVT